MTLLDIGGGIGMIQHELLKEGLKNAISIDASNAYNDISKQEAEKNGYAERIQYHFGNYVELESKVPKSDIVTLDKVVCCYPDLWSLVGLSVQKAERFYSLIYPRDTWWAKVGVSFANFGLWVIRKNFRAFVHPTKTIDKVVRRFGFEQRFRQTSSIWQIVVYGKV